MKWAEQRTRKYLFEYLPMLITGIGILVCAIVFKQMFIKVLPLFFSLIIMLLNSRANRIGFLLGAANSGIYLIGYFLEGVYGTMASTLFGIVMALIAYFRWKKDSYGKATMFRSFSVKQRIFGAGFLLLAWSICSFILWKMDGTAVAFDGIVLVLGILIPILNIWAFLESAFLNVLSVILQVVMWMSIIITGDNLASLTYLIYMIYVAYMVFRAFLRWVALYKEQQSLREKKEI